MLERHRTFLLDKLLNLEIYEWDIMEMSPKVIHK
mgnify:CR=1 FL=1